MLSTELDTGDTRNITGDNVKGLTTVKVSNVYCSFLINQASRNVENYVEIENVENVENVENYKVGQE